MPEEMDPHVEDLENESQSQYDEDAFNQMIEDDEEANDDDEQELSDFPEGAEGNDGKADIDSDEQPEGKEAKPDDDQGSDTKAEKDDPESDKDDGPDLPAWIEALPEDQQEAAVTDFLKLHQDIERINARYESQSGQLKPTQRRLAKMEQIVKKFSTAMKPGDDIDARAKDLETWIEKHGEDFPDEAEDLRAAFDAYRTSISSVTEAAINDSSAQGDDADGVDRSLQRRLLERMEDSAAQIALDPSFKAYLQQHPEHAAQAQSPFAHDVIEVIDAFRKDTNWQPPTRSENFQHVNQMLVSPLFSGWAQAIGLSSEQVQGFDAASQAKVFNQFKVDLDAAHADDGSDNEGGSEASRLANKRNKRKMDHSPAARGTRTGGGKPTALRGEDYFNQLEV